jgi:hypothetical protein
VCAAAAARHSSRRDPSACWLDYPPSRLAANFVACCIAVRQYDRRVTVRLFLRYLFFKIFLCWPLLIDLEQAIKHYHHHQHTTTYLYRKTHGIVLVHMGFWDCRPPMTLAYLHQRTLAIPPPRAFIIRCTWTTELMIRFTRLFDTYNRSFHVAGVGRAASTRCAGRRRSARRRTTRGALARGAVRGCAAQRGARSARCRAALRGRGQHGWHSDGSLYSSAMRKKSSSEISTRNRKASVNWLP